MYKLYPFNVILLEVKIDYKIKINNLKQFLIYQFYKHLHYFK
jgi:hypothetical protein